MNTFRQGTIGRIEVTVLTHSGALVPQPSGSPTLEIVYIDPDNGRMTTALPRTTMFEIEPGRYFFNWKVPLNQPLLAHQAIHRGEIDDQEVIGEDVFTVLPATPQCLREPCLLTTLKAQRGCRC